MTSMTYKINNSVDENTLSTGGEELGNKAIVFSVTIQNHHQRQLHMMSHIAKCKYTKIINYKR